MKNKNTNYYPISEFNNGCLADAQQRADGGAVSDHQAPIKIQRLILAALALVLAGGGCSLRQAYPQTQIRGYINGQPFSVQAPKDSNLTGFDAIAETNGAVHVHIDSLQSSLNPTNLVSAANGQAAIVTATAQAINQAMVTAAAAAAKAAIAP